MGGSGTCGNVSVPRSDPSSATLEAMRNGVPVSASLWNARPSQVPAYFRAGPAGPPAPGLSPGVQAAAASAAQTSERMRAASGCGEVSPMPMHPCRVSQIRVLDGRHILPGDPPDVVPGHAVETLGEFVALLVAAEVQLGAGQKVGLPRRCGVFPEGVEAEAADEAAWPQRVD